jgi:NAD(P)-dependent dehydrogenase (short-subunit alcohol dehydrogenase family)
VRAALVTGASSGIGLAIARMLAEEGYALTLSARGRERLERAAGELRRAGAETLTVTANAASAEDVAALVDAHRERFGRLDVLVNNAGYGGPVGPPSGLATRHLDLLLDVNLRAARIAIARAEPLLRAAGAEHGKALVVNMASVAGTDGLAGAGAYSAAKAALVGLSAGLDRELAEAGIQVTAVCPALVDTAMSRRAAVPPEAMLRSEDVAEGVRFLLRTSAVCHVRELVLRRPTGVI